MQTELPKPDFTDPQPAFAGMSDKQLLKHYRMFKTVCKPFLIKIGEWLGKQNKIPVWIYKWAVKKTIYKIFVGGETLQECQPTIDELDSKGVGSVPDLSIKSVSSEKAVDAAVNDILDTIKLSQRNRKKVPFTVFKLTGLIKKDVLIAISGKIKSGQQLSDSERTEWNRLIGRADKLCGEAYQAGVRIMIDAEETWIQIAIDTIAHRMMQCYNKENVTVLNTYQMYRKNAVAALQNDFEKAVAGGYKFGVKIVRGAYMEKEREEATKHGYDSPINEMKEDTDNEYNNGLRFCIENISSILIVAGTHNKASIQYLMSLMEEHEIPRNSDSVHFSQLFGMGDILSCNLSKFGYNVCKYLPFGPVKDVIPYLTRRARENSSINGFTSQELQTIIAEIQRRSIAIT